MSVDHPRFLSVPGMPGLNAPSFFFASLRTAVRSVRGAPVDVILAAYAYPAGVSAFWMSRVLSIPVVVKCQGSDLHRAPRDPIPRRWISMCLPRCEGVVTVSRELKAVALSLGANESRVSVIYNGVDRSRFFPADKRIARRSLALTEGARIVLFVGHLADHKGVSDLLDAVQRIHREGRGIQFVFVGDGPLLQALKMEAQTMPETVVVRGRVAHEKVPDYIAASDLLCLPSWGEGMPNVVREAHASGRPVVATDVGGVPEAISSRTLGRLVPSRNPEALAASIVEMFEQGMPSADDVVRAANIPTWEESAANLLSVLDRARTVNGRRR